MVLPVRKIPTLLSRKAFCYTPLMCCVVCVCVFFYYVLLRTYQPKQSVRCAKHPNQSEAVCRMSKLVGVIVCSFRYLSRDIFLLHSLLTHFVPNRTIQFCTYHHNIDIIISI